MGFLGWLRCILVLKTIFHTLIIAIRRKDVLDIIFSIINLKLILKLGVGGSNGLRKTHR